MGICRGVKDVLLNGKKISGNLLPTAELKPENKATVVLS
jgi:hypothetical protein